jgi:hypothetical protein
MAKNKKRKKAQPARPQKSMMVNKSKNYLDACYATARRIFRAMGENPDVLDVFTKRQKQDMFRMVLLPPRVAAMPGHKAPGYYVRYIQDQLLIFLKRNYFNKEEGVTWMDIATIGLSMYLVFSSDSAMLALSDAQMAEKERLSKLFEEQKIYLQIHIEMSQWIRATLMMLSQPNFRIYGQVLSETRSVGKVGVCLVVHITAHDSRSIRINYHNTERKAYLIAVGECMDMPYRSASIAMSKIFPNVENDRQLNIYIQSHAIHRFKERIDTIAPVLRNELFILSLMEKQVVVRGTDGTPLIACIVPVDEGHNAKAVGYFTFTISDDTLLVLTLLPLLSQSVPEGRILYDRLRLSAEDLRYLGMDKLSFFYEVDIEQIPVLKKVLFDELHLEYIRTVYNSYQAKDEPFNEKRTLFVKNFFRKFEEYAEEVTVTATTECES